MNLVFIGQQGAGKGTVSSLVKDKLNVPHISTGDIFREAIKNETEIGKIAKALINDGNMVPDDIVVKLVKERIAQSDCAKGFILDGFPRNKAQAEQLDAIVKLDHVVLLEITDDLTVKRLSSRRVCKKCAATYNIDPKGFPIPKHKGVCDECGGELYQRADDEENAIRERLRIYHSETEPVLEFYKEKGLLKPIDSSRKIELVVEDVLNAIK